MSTSAVFVFMSKLKNVLYEEIPIVVNPRLAKELNSSDAAIIVQQIHYWCNINKAAGRNFHDGRYWTYNSYEKWHEYFPWISVRTLKTLFTTLEKKGYIISGNYNQMKMDRTKWYTLNYDFEIDDLPSCKNCTMESAEIARPIPETTSQRLTYNPKECIESNIDGVPSLEEESVINSENAVSDLYVKCARDSNLPAYDGNIRWAVKIVDEYINEWYQEETGKRHIQIASLSEYADRLVECQQILEHDRGAETEPEDFEKALKTAVKWHDCKDPTIMWATSPKVLGYWLVESGVCYYQDVMGTKYGFSDDAEKAYEHWKESW